MTGESRRFDFTFTPDETKEAIGAARRTLGRLGRVRLRRLALVIALAVLAGVSGFTVAPLAAGPLPVASQALVCVLCFLATVAGALAERVVTLLCMRAMTRPYMRNYAAARTVTLDAAGALDTAAGRRFGLDWSARPSVLRGRTLLLLLSPSGEWVGVPTRLFPDAGAQLERDIAAWRQPP